MSSTCSEPMDHTRVSSYEGRSIVIDAGCTELADAVNDVTIEEGCSRLAYKRRPEADGILADGLAVLEVESTVGTDQERPPKRQDVRAEGQHKPGAELTNDKESDAMLDGIHGHDDAGTSSSWRGRGGGLIHTTASRSLQVPRNPSDNPSATPLAAARLRPAGGANVGVTPATPEVQPAEVLLARHHVTPPSMASEGDEGRLVEAGRPSIEDILQQQATAPLTMPPEEPRFSPDTITYYPEGDDRPDMPHLPFPNHRPRERLAQELELRFNATDTEHIAAARVAGGSVHARSLDPRIFGWEAHDVADPDHAEKPFHFNELDTSIFGSLDTVTLGLGHSQPGKASVSLKSWSDSAASSSSGNRLVLNFVYNWDDEARPDAVQPLSSSPHGALQALLVKANKGLASQYKKCIPELSSSGTSGSYYFKDTNGDNAGVFKPMDEEPSTPNNPRGRAGSRDEGLRSGIEPGDGALREVAAFELDHGNFAGVPPTALVSLKAGGAERWCKMGSLQQFVKSEGSCEDWGSSKFPTHEVHKIAIIDMRFANTDRHDGNILVLKLPNGTFQLVPIDHGCCLPSSFKDIWFVWLDWKQAREPFCEECLQYIKNLDPEHDLQRLKDRKLELQHQCKLVLRVCTGLLKRGAARGMSPWEIGGIMSRALELNAPSPLETMHDQVTATGPLSDERYLDAMAQRIDNLIEKYRPTSMEQLLKTYNQLNEE